ncbi:MFS transporter [Candidatus Bipolaricaulota bacterium]|nr:MFS transporter [Candidatus Bipolaricaulota bacterium]
MPASCCRAPCPRSARSSQRSGHLYGGGWTFISGAEDAWLADELGADALPHAYLRAKQISLAASFAGVLSSVAIASLRLNLPFLLSGFALIGVAVLLFVIMPETRFRRATADERSTWHRMGTTLASGFRSIRVSPLLLTIMAATLLFGVSREGIDRLWEAHLLDTVRLPVLGNLDTVVWFGVINAVAMLAALVLSLVLQRQIRRFTDRRAVIWLIARNVLLGGGIIAFALSGSFVAIVAAFVAVYTLRELGAAVQSAWVNRSIESESRATVLSTINQMDAIGQACGGPATGRWERGLDCEPAC